VILTIDTDRPQSKIIRYVHGTSGSNETCCMIFAYLTSSTRTQSIYQTEYIVPISDANSERTYVDPNGVVYNFVYTDTNFTIDITGCYDWWSEFYDFVGQWLDVTYPKSDFNCSGMVDFKDYAFLCTRYVPCANLQAM
jgi:hypothetical protein